MRTVRIVVVTVPASDTELAADRLWRAGARAVEERPVPDDHVEVRSVLAADDTTSLARLGDIPPAWSVRCVDEPEAPATTWRDFAVPIEIAPDLVLRPAWLPPLAVDGVVEVAIEPSGAFGLGDHPTTRLAAAATRRYVRDGDRVLDVGCGSGVLSIVAARSGASAVVAVDTAEAAREATIDNASRNGVGDIVRASTTPIADVSGRYDVVLANILAPTLVALAADMRRLLAGSGILVVSGILADRHDHVLAALAPLRPIATETFEGWAAVSLCR